MRFIGADLHKKSITFCVVEKVPDGIRVVGRKRIMCCEVHRIEEFLKSHAPCRLTVEATIGYEWFAGVAEQIAERVVIAHAGSCASSPRALGRQTGSTRTCWRSFSLMT